MIDQATTHLAKGDRGSITAAVCRQTDREHHLLRIQIDGHEPWCLYGATLDQLETLADSLVGELAAARHAEHLAAMEPIPFLPASLVDDQPAPFVPLEEYRTGGVSTRSSAASSDEGPEAA